MDEKKLYEEYSTLPAFWGWAVLIAFSFMILGLALLMHWNVRDVPREWNFGQEPQTPAESIYSSLAPPAGRSAPAQILGLPEAKPVPPGGLGNSGKSPMLSRRRIPGTKGGGEQAGNGKKGARPEKQQQGNQTGENPAAEGGRP